VRSREARRREAWQLITWVGTVIAGLLIVYCLSGGAPLPRTGAVAPLMAPCWIGYVISVVVGTFVTFGWASLLVWL
jgi:hypothetical protein